MFKLFFAGWGSKDADEYLRSKKANRLLSWINEGRVIEWWEKDNLAHKLLIDSGAFSVAHSGAVVDIDEYLQYISTHNMINNWAELDVIPYPVLDYSTAKKCSDASWDNYVYMRNKCDRDCILPLYHFGEPDEGLQRILNTRINGELVDYIGIGGRHGVSTIDQVDYFNDVFSIIKSSDNPNVKVHAFGVTVPRILEYFPFYSADSTTWLQAAINGSILDDNLQMITISDGTNNKKDNIQNMPSSAVSNVKKLIHNYGYDYEQLKTDYKQRLRYNIDVMLNWETNYTYKGPEHFTTNRLF